MIALFTASAPFRNGGTGCNILCDRFLSDTDGVVSTVIMRHGAPPESFKHRMRNFTYREAGGLGLGRFAPVLRARVDGTLCRWEGRRAADRLRSLGVSRLFGFAGANWRFLLQLENYAKGAGIPYDIYLVDDFETSLLPGASSRLRELVRRIESRVLRNAGSVYAISSGYCEHLFEKYGVPAAFLPYSVSPNRRFSKHTLTERLIVFIGSVNRLYMSPILELANAINCGTVAGTYRIRIVSLGKPPTEIEEYCGKRIIEWVEGRSVEDLRAAMAPAWALFLPYSFEMSVRKLVETSFPTKLTDYAEVGRPILIYAPSSASTSRYANKYGWRWVAHDIVGLNRILATASEDDALAEWQRQLNTVSELHAPNAIRDVLLSRR